MALVGKLSIPVSELESWKQHFESSWYLAFEGEDITILSASLEPWGEDQDNEGQVVIYTGDYPDGHWE